MLLLREHLEQTLTVLVVAELVLPVLELLLRELLVATVVLAAVVAAGEQHKAQVALEYFTFSIRSKQ
jgi:hypothetical protein